ncbi:hypothetical protein Hdeb2414_s0015g00452321 [Helianthus debilis subsp. tardiflorus]
MGKKNRVLVGSTMVFSHIHHIFEFLVSGYSVYFHSFDIIFATYLDPEDLIRADTVLVEEVDLIQTMGLCSVLCCFQWQHG